MYEDYKAYLATFKDFPNALGQTRLTIVNNELYVANCITQVYTGFDKNGNPPASCSAIEDCLTQVVGYCNTFGLDLYTPQIGCGLGGLDWTIEVKPIYEKVSEHLSSDLNWYVCTI